MGLPSGDSGYTCIAEVPYCRFSTKISATVAEQIAESLNIKQWRMS